MTFQRLCLAGCIITFGLIVLGGLVRHTDSGLGCGDDWPRCEGSFIPRFEKNLLIEYSHRLVASVAGVVIFGLAVWAWKSYRQVPAVVVPATLAFVLVLLQGGLGAAAVRNELSPRIVAIHLGMALTILTLLVLLLVTVKSLERPLAPMTVSREYARVAALAAGLTFALMVVGSYVSGAGYGLACSGWPLCNGDVVPSTEATSVQLVFVHRFLALALGVSLLALAWLGAKTGGVPLHAALGLLVVYGAQALVGAANVWSLLSAEAGVVHLALGTLLWSLVVFLTIRVFNLHELLPQASRSRGDLAGVTR